jgi:HEAT repeat protein
MSVLRADKILDYLASPLSKCLKDENPYVRKTAALCVAKVFDLKPELCVEYGFIDTLKDLIGDGNPMVSLLCIPVEGNKLISRSSLMPSLPLQTSTKPHSIYLLPAQARQMALHHLHPPDLLCRHSSLIHLHCRSF